MDDIHSPNDIRGYNYTHAAARESNPVACGLSIRRGGINAAYARRHPPHNWEDMDVDEFVAWLVRAGLVPAEQVGMDG